MQDIIKDENGTIRFKANEIVNYLLERCDIDLNYLATRDEFTQSDWGQFYQLVGYSVTGYHGLDRVSDESALEASDIAIKVFVEEVDCRLDGCSLHSGVEKHD